MNAVLQRNIVSNMKTMENMLTIPETEGENYDTALYLQQHGEVFTDTTEHRRPNAMEVHQLVTMNKPLL